MKSSLSALVAAIVTFGAITSPLAADMKDKVKVEIESVGLHPGMDPGMYVCASGHLHIKGVVHNTATVPLGRVRVAAKAFNADGTLLGEAVASTKQASIAPGDKAPIDLEFLTVGGPLIRSVKQHQVTVIEAPTR